jgi:hypothetical protein
VIAQRQIELRSRLWPGLDAKTLWIRTERDGFITIPRTMPLILDIMDDMSKNKPVSSTYLELWCRSYDECFVTLAKQREMAFHAGFSGQRAEHTWSERMKILHKLGFIEIKEGPSGPLSYALIYNPYLIIKKHYPKKTSGLRNDKYNALITRTTEIGADDMFEVSEKKKKRNS